MLASTTIWPQGALFHMADEARRQQGRLLDALGFGPQSLPSRSVGSWGPARLLAYAPSSSRPVVLIVPAPIKTGIIWDLAPGASAVARWLGSRLQVFRIEWLRPGSGARDLALAQYAQEAIHACVEAIRAHTGEAKVVIAGHSLGGTFAAIYASLHPERVRGLVQLEAPIAFGEGRLEAVVASAPHARHLTRQFGNVPGTFLDLASAYADPLAFGAEPWLDWLRSVPSAKRNRLHWRVRRWSLDETPMPCRLFEEVVELLYRKNRFAEGRLRVGGRSADPRRIDVPILAVVDPRSRVVPPAAVEAYRRCTASKDVEMLQYRGDGAVVMQHVGVLVGRNAHRRLWPKIVDWTTERSP